MLVAMVAMARLTLTTPLWMIVVVMSVQGGAWGLTTSPTMVAGMGELPTRLLAQGTTVRSLATQVSGVLTIAVLGSVVSIRMGSHPTAPHAQAAFNSAFVVGSFIAVAALFLASRLPDRAEHLHAAAVTHLAHD
jgi:hypothetical protein